MRQQFVIEMAAGLRDLVKRGRKRRALWVRAFDIARHFLTVDGRARVWTLLRHGNEVHQTTSYTFEDRYPELFARAAALIPAANRILSFGCSTGEELLTLRRYFPQAHIIGAEINARSRRIAAKRLASDRRVRVVPPAALTGSFDLIFALAVLQREPVRVQEMGVNLMDTYPFERFDKAVSTLVALLGPEGVLCVANSHYRVEDSSASMHLHPIANSPRVTGLFFDSDGNRLTATSAPSMFQKVKPCA